MTKFGNIRTSVGNRQFDSKAEAADYTVLRLREMAGQISQLRCQVTFPLLDAFTASDGVSYRPVTWRADFTYVEGGQLIAYETKGKELPAWKIKRRLFVERYPEVTLIVHHVARRPRR